MSELRLDPLKFLNEAGFDPFDLRKLPSDASQRTYYKFSSGNDRLVLMDAPPATNPKNATFVDVTEHLLAADLVAPEILRSDLKQGYLILRDLGETTARDVLELEPSREVKIYREILNTLFKIETLGVRDLPVLTNSTAGEMTTIAATSYADAPELGVEISALIEGYFEDFCDTERTFALRDFHVENVIWRDDKASDQQVGLLDYQDAFYAPKGYDLVSLLRDVRGRVSSETQDEMIDRYLDHYGRGNEFEVQLHCLAIQRNLRILGVFGRLVREEGKSKYLQFLPRTWELLMEDLEPRQFNELKSLLLEHFPEPTDELFASWGVRY